MNFRTIFITIIIFISLIFARDINRQRNTNHFIVKKDASANRSVDEIITIDFEFEEDDLNEWYQDYTEGWFLTNQESNHSYNSPDNNNSGEVSIHSLFSEEISLPSLVEGEIIQYSFSLNCNMPDYIQEDIPSTPDDESTYFADYYTVSIADLNQSSAWHISDFNSTSEGNNWWCGDEENNGYFDNWVQFLDTDEITITSAATLTVDMKWGIEDTEGAVDEFPDSCIDGWDQANVQISTDNGDSWSVINGSNPYDFDCGYGSVYNGFGYEPGWSGIQDWHNLSFDLNEYIGQTIMVRFAFYSDPAYNTEDDPELTGLQIDNILVTTDDSSEILFSNTAADESNMSVSGLSWIDQFYEACYEGVSGYLEWDTFGPGDAFNGNILMDLTEFANKTIRFRFQTTYDGNHFSASDVVDDAQGEGLYIDDLYLYKMSTFNPIPPSGLSGYLIDDKIHILWDDLNISGTGDFVYDNGNIEDGIIMSDDNSIEEGEVWAGAEIYTAGTSIVDSVYIYVFGAFDGQLAGFSSFGTDYDIDPDYSESIAVLLLNEDFEIDLNEESWVGIDVNEWTFYGSFIIGLTLGTTSLVGIDDTNPSSHSKAILNSGWENWIDIVSNTSNPLIEDGEWAIRTVVNYLSPNVTYNLYRDNAVIGSELQTFEYEDENIEMGNTYTYNVSAVYPNGDESPKSENFIFTVENCEDAPGCECDSCNNSPCIFDCSLDCIDATVEGENVLSYYKDNNNCDDGEEDGEINLDCAEIGDGSDCIIDLSLDEDLDVPKIFQLGQNFPNPFNPITTIPFSIPEISNVDFNIYNVLGQQVYQKSWKGLSPGNYEHLWNGKNFNSGVYIYTIETNSGIYLKEKMVLIK